MSEPAQSPAERTCPGCGAVLPQKAPEGLCPRCLLGGALHLGGLESEPPVDDDPLASLLEGRKVANYEIIQMIARGGMGAVFRARQKEPERVVALKVIAAGELATRRMVERFRTEAEAAARLDHPNIVPIYEVGHDAGWHFFSMRLIEGGTLGENLRGNGLPPRDAALLLIKIARAVHHAHERGVLHRDLKPGNILLDARGEPHLTDFGLAKVLESSVELTLSNVALGTPAYMAPEQAAGGTRDITLSADVYGLGAVFYEMLTGRPPFEAPSTHALLRRVAEDEPIPPSQVHSARRKSALVRAAKAAPDKQHGIDQLLASSAAANALFADLDAICLKCLEKEPVLRYRSAQELADDLERAVRGEVISARPSTATQRVRKWVRRNPAKVAVIASITSVLLAGTAVSTWQAIRATRATREQSRLRLAELELRRLAEKQSYAADINLAQQTLAQNNLGRARDLLLRYRPQDGQEDLPGWEWRYLWQQTRSDAEYELARLPDPVFSISVSADGQWLAAGQLLGGLVVFDLKNRIEVFRDEHRIQRVATAFSPGEPLLAYVFFGSPDRSSIRLWNPAARTRVAEIPLREKCFGLQFSDDGSKLLSSTDGPAGGLLLWNVADQKLLASVPADPEETLAMAASNDLSLVVDTLRGGKLRMVDLRTGKTLWTVQATDELIQALALSPDRALVASGAGYADSAIRLWDAHSGRELGRLDGHLGYVHDLRFLPDGNTLISASADQTIRLWDVANRRSISVLRGHRQEVRTAALLPNQHTLASGAKDGSILVWNLERVRPQIGRIIFPAPAQAYAFGPNGKTILLAESAGAISEWSGVNFRDRRVLHDFGTNLMTKASFTPSGSRVAVELPNRRAVVWDLATQRALSEFDLPPGTSYVGELDDSGNQLFLDNFNSTDLHQWDVPANRFVESWHVPGISVVSGDFSPDGHWRIALNLDGSGVARDAFAQTNRPFAVRIKDPDGAGLTADGQILAIPSLLGYVRLWDWPSLREIATLPGFLRGAHSVRFSPDGKRLAAGSSGNEAVKLWDMATHRELVTLAGEGSIFVDLRFSPDGNMLGARNSAGIVHLWFAPSLSEIETLAASAKDGH